MRIRQIASSWLVALGCGETGGVDESTSGTTTGGDVSSGTSGGPSSETSSGAGETTGTGASSESGTPIDCSGIDGLPPGDHERMLEHDGAMRRFIVHVPAAHDASVAVPLLVNMHGLLSNPEQQIDWSLMNAAADPRGWIGVYPAGIANSWNAGTCCGDASANGVDDVGFIRAMVADIESVLCIDPRRVYATGMSNGGHMSYRLACDAADLFAAVAPVAGAMRTTSCAPTRPIPVLAFHGVQDLIVPYADDVSSIDGWVATDACDPMAMQENFPGGNCQRYSGCDADTAVGLCTLDPMGHCWPGGSEGLCFGFLGAYSDALDADATMLDFFEQHRLP